MRKSANTSRVTLMILLAAGSLCSFGFGTAIGATWSKQEVVPVVLVRPSIGGFAPTEGSPLGNTWTKDEVKPVVLVKPGIAGFEPREGFSIGNDWPKDSTIPVMLVEPSGSGFVPLREIADSNQPQGTTSPSGPTPSASLIESQIAGEFEGWEGETIIKLDNGQIWQQSEYYYTYHYAFRPKVLIYHAAGGYKMKVEGVEKPVGVILLK